MNPLTTTLKTLAAAATLAASVGMVTTPAAAQGASDTEALVYSRETEVQGVNIFYRESGEEFKGDRPTVILLHGFPTSSHMFRDLIPVVGTYAHVIAPDYPGYGLSDDPSVDEFEYTFDNLSDIVEEVIDREGVDEYVLYLMDYGAPVGYRIAARNPDKVEGLIVQNGNAYVEGLPDSFWGPIAKDWEAKSDETREPLRGLLTIEATKWQYTTGTRDPDAISPDNYLAIQPKLDRPGNQEIQLALFRDYGTNPPLYPSWQAYFREHQPPTLITWGKNDPIFPAEGAIPYLRDLENVELHLLNTGHFALEEDGELIAQLIRRWYDREVSDID